MAQDRFDTEIILFLEQKVRGWSHFSNEKFIFPLPKYPEDISRYLFPRSTMGILTNPLVTICWHNGHDWKAEGNCWIVHSIISTVCAFLKCQTCGNTAKLAMPVLKDPNA